jgi:glycosyltransferase involved in cell wall biosynthesis
MDLTVVIPTRNRRAILAETVARLERQADEERFEVVVVDDGSDDGTPDWVAERASSSPLPITLLRQPGTGPAAARNRGLAVAQAPVCLCLDDDTWPRPGLVRRHLEFHRAHPEPQAALLGHVTVPDDPPPTPFMRWHATLHMGHHHIDDHSDVEGAHFYSGNVSAKTAFLRDAGGFDEGFAVAAHDDIDLGLRLERRGMRLAYDPEAVVEHYQPIDLWRAIERLHATGRALVRFAERHPDRPLPRRPGTRHRVKAGALAALAVARVRRPALQRETWRFVCHEAAREGYWSARAGAPPPARAELRIGRLLARLASRDPDAQMPADRLSASSRPQALSV